MAAIRKLGVAGDSNQQIGMTLAEIAYSEPKDLACQLAYPHYATASQWTLRWLGVSPGNQMYVAYNDVTQQWAVAVRGSTTDPMSESFWIDWFEEDLTTLKMEPLPFGDVPGALIAWGTLQGFKDLIAMKDETRGQTLVDFLTDNVVLEPISVVVLGHSLGGVLASVLAPYLYETVCKPQQKPPECIVSMTFAAPTAGNDQFAHYLEGLFDGCPFRYLNSLDIVPKCWSLSGLDWIMNSYDPAPQISDFFWALVDADWWMLYGGGYNYTQPGPGDPVTGVLQGYFWWFEEVGYQHMGETYLKLYGAPSVVFPCPPKSPVTGVMPRRERPAIK